MNEKMTDEAVKALLGQYERYTTGKDSMTLSAKTTGDLARALLEARAESEGAHMIIATERAEVLKLRAENARLRADARAAVARVVEKAADSLLECSVWCDSQPRTDDGWRNGVNDARKHGMAAIRALAPVDGLAMVEALRKERDSFRAVLEGAEYGNVDNIANNDVKTSRAPGQVVKQLTLNCYADRDRLTADLAAARAQIEALADALEELKQWADAYPTKVFPEPDLARAAAILSQGGMSLDVISASNMRHVLTRVAQITRAALAALPAKEGE